MTEKKQGSGEHAITAVGPQMNSDAMERVVDSIVTKGDISGLSPRDRARYYIQTCEALGLNPATKPFDILRLNGKDVMYPNRGATDQLARIHCLNREIIDGPKVIDLAGTKLAYALCKATLPSGRVETSVATVPLQDPANVFMRVETKSKRRATLSILGLGMLDEMEIDGIPVSAKGVAQPIDLRAAETPAQPVVRVVQPAPTPITDDAINAAEIASWCARIEVAKGTAIAELAPHIDAVAAPVRGPVVQAYAAKWLAAWQGADDKARRIIKARIVAMPADLRTELEALLPEVFPQPTPPDGDRPRMGEHPAADDTAPERDDRRAESGDSPVATLEGWRSHLLTHTRGWGAAMSWHKHKLALAPADRPRGLALAKDRIMACDHCDETAADELLGAAEKVHTKRETAKRTAAEAVKAAAA